MIQYIPAGERFLSKLAWLKSYHLFSFAQYYDPDNIQFGTLRVFNDDFIDAYYGFDEHPHADMEIVTIMLDGTITHRDSMGNTTKISAGEVQRMSAGKGVVHAEKNLEGDPVHLYQIWFLPRQRGIAPSYAQTDFSYRLKSNDLTLLVRGTEAARGKTELAMYADADVYRGQFVGGATYQYDLATGRGVCIYITVGEMRVNGTVAAAGDQLRITDESKLTFDFAADTQFILVDVGM